MFKLSQMWPMKAPLSPLQPAPSFSEDFLALGIRFSGSFSVSSAGVASPWYLDWWWLVFRNKDQSASWLITTQMWPFSALHNSLYTHRASILQVHIHMCTSIKIHSFYIKYSLCLSQAPASSNSMLQFHSHFFFLSIFLTPFPTVRNVTSMSNDMIPSWLLLMASPVTILLLWLWHHPVLWVVSPPSHWVCSSLS